MPKVAREVKRLLSEGKREVAQRVAGGMAELLRLERLYGLTPVTAKPVRRKPAKKARLTQPRKTGRKSRKSELAKMQRETDWRLGCVERVVCAVFGVSRKRLPSRSQDAPVPAARMAFCCLARELVEGASKSEIMRYVDRDHATLGHYEREFSKRLEGQWFADAVKDCRKQLAQAFEEQR